MRHVLRLLVLTAVLTTACHRADLTAARKAVATPKAVATGSAPVHVTGSATPAPASPAPGATPSASASAPTTLAVQALPDSVPFKGLVTLDAAYVISNNAGTLLSDQGAGAVVAVGPYLRAGDGGSLVSDQGAGVLANHSAGLIANNGSGIIANNSGGLVANNSAGLVANNGGGLAGQNKRQLLEAASRLDAGSQLPAAGMTVQIVSLWDGTVLPLARRADGKAVTSVQTDASGHFTAFLPADQVGNVRVVARPPGQLDDRLAVERVGSAASAGDQAVDADTAAVVRYLRAAFTAHVNKILSTQDVSALVSFYATSWHLPAAVREQVSSMITDLHAAALSAQVPDAPAADQARLAARVADQLIAVVDIEHGTINKQVEESWEGPEEPAVPAMQAVLAAMREGTAKALQRDPHFLDTLPFVEAANAFLPSGQHYQLAAPADLGAFAIDAYFIRIDDHKTTDHFDHVLESVGARLDPATGLDQGDRMVAATDSLVAAMGLALSTDQAGARAAAIATVQAFKPGSP